MKEKVVEFNESISPSNVNLVEAKEDGKDVFKIVVESAVSSGVRNANGRIYPKDVLKEAYDELVSGGDASPLRLKVENGVATGEAEHPNWDKRPNWLNTIVVWTDASWVEDGDTARIDLEGVIIPNSKGMDAITNMRAGVKPGVSLRGRGSSKMINDKGVTNEVVQRLRFVAFDVVGTPSFENTATITESTGDIGNMDLEELKQENPELYAQLLEKAKGDKEAVKAKLLQEVLAEQEAQEKLLLEKARQKEESEKALLNEHTAQLRQELGLSDSDDLLEAVRKQRETQEKLVLENARRSVSEELDNLIEEASKNYPEQLAQAFTKAVKDGTKGMTDAQQAKKLFESKRAEYNTIVSHLKTLEMGYQAQARSAGVSFVGANLSESGIPDYALATVPLVEAIRESKHGSQVGWNPTKVENYAQRFAAKYLEAFDNRYQAQLARETRLFQESNSTADLQLPYSVSRAIIFEAFPQLIGSQLFDFGIGEGNPIMIHCEEWDQDTEIFVNVIENPVNIVTADTKVALQTGGIVPGSDTVIYDPGGADVELSYGSDYVIDYKTGEIWILSTSPLVLDSTITFPAVLSVEYTYDKLCNLECDIMEQSKLKIVQKQLDMCALRLASEICYEAIAFSRANLGYDLVQRNIAHLVRVIREKVDHQVMYEAATAALQFVGNYPNGMPPTWNAGSGTVESLIEAIGYASVLIKQRNYMPDWILTTPLIAEILSNWVNFCDNCQVELGPNGLAGSVKGLPIYTSNLFGNDDLIILGTRDSVYHRVLEPMSIKGPVYKQKPVETVPGSGEYDNTRLVDAEIYFARQISGELAPVPEKLSFVRVVQ